MFDILSKLKDLLESPIESINLFMTKNTAIKATCDNVEIIS